jgi:glycerol-3-phosphate O-acyltransferase / dihydroxyacetone phosphate acyltransferase
MIYSILKSLVRITLKLFYKEFKVTGRFNMLSEGPILIASNHPNTMIDPMVVGSLFTQRMGFMAKSTIFLNPLVTWFLTKLHIIPIHRQMDAKEGTQIDNTNAFRRCFEYLKNKGTVIIFPEGVSFQEMRLNPVKTGAARIALDFELQNKFEAGLRIIPVSLNYSDPARFHSDLTVNIGKPIFVRDYKEEYNTDPHECVRKLTNEIKSRLGDLLVHTEDAEQELLFRRIKKIYEAQLQAALNIAESPKAKFELKKEMVNGLNFVKNELPEEYKAMEKKVTAYFKMVKALNLHDDFINHKRKKSANYVLVFLTILYLVIISPIYIAGLITNFIPYKIPDFGAQLLTKTTSYHAPLMMILGFFVFPLFYAAEIILFYNYTGNAIYTSVFAISLPFLGFFVLHYWNRVLWIKSLSQIFILKIQKQSVIENLKSRRRAIIEDLDRMKEAYINKEKEEEMAVI